MLPGLDAGEGAPHGLDRQHAVTLQPMVRRLAGHLHGLGECFDALGIRERNGSGIFNLTDETKRLAQQIRRVLRQDRRGEKERRAQNEDR
jgi:hypothetical protein